MSESMIELRGGAFRMGSDRFYPEERPVREVSVAPFAIDRHPVTVAEFRRFVKATGHVTWAERAPAADDYPDADPALPRRAAEFDADLRRKDLVVEHLGEFQRLPGWRDDGSRQHDQLLDRQDLELCA